MKNRILRCLMCALLISCLFLNLFSQPAQAADPVSMGYMAAEYGIPLILAWLGITANPEAPEAFAQVSQGLTDHLTSKGLINNGQIDSYWVPSAAGPGEQVLKAGLQYLPEALLNEALLWGYNSEKPLLEKNDIDLPPEGQKMVDDAIAQRRYYATFYTILGIEHQRCDCIAVSTNPIIYNGRSINCSYYNLTLGQWFGAGRGTCHEFSAHSPDDYKLVRSTANVQLGKVPLVGQTASHAIVDSGVTSIKSITVAGKPVSAVPVNPGWSVSTGTQAQAQTPVAVPNPFPPPAPVEKTTLQVKGQFTDGLLETSISVPVPVGQAIGQSVLDQLTDAIADSLGADVAAAITGWSVAGVAVDAETIVLEDWKVITATIATTKPVAVPDSSLLSTLKYWWSISLKSLKEMLLTLISPLVEAFQTMLQPLFGWLLDGIKALCIPQANYLSVKVETLCNKFTFAKAIILSGKTIKDAINNLNGGPPQIWIDLSAARNNPFNWGGKVLFMDLSWYSEYKGRGDIILGGFFWACFIWKVFKRLPGLISGASGDAHFLGSKINQNVEDV